MRTIFGFFFLVLLLVPMQGSGRTPGLGRAVESGAIYQEYLSKLFDTEINAIDLIKKRDILTTLEKAIDKCDDVSNIFSSLIVKMG